MKKENINQNLVHTNYRDISPDTPVLADINSDISTILLKIIECGYVICIDFSKGRVVKGVIAWTDIRHAIEKKPIDELKMEDVINKQFVYSDIKNLDKNISRLGKVAFMPVVDDDMNFLFIVKRDSCHIWDDAQNFEINWWRDYYKNHMGAGNQQVFINSIKIIETMLLPASYIEEIRKKIATKGATVIEIGAGPALGYMPNIPVEDNRIIIEPLCEKYAALRQEFNYKVLNEDGIYYYPQGGDIHVAALNNTADVVLCMNMLDHTPEWPFVIGNISDYAKSGGLVYISNDIDHHAAHIPGHFNITYNPEKFIRLVRQFGFEILWSHYWTRNDPHGCTWVSILAKKR